jgi:hypothetical protein
MTEDAFASLVEFTAELAPKETVETPVIEQVADVSTETQETLDSAAETEDKTQNLENQTDTSVADANAELQKAVAGVVENLRKNRKNLRNIKK